MLDPGPDKAVDAAGWNPALECRERRSAMRLPDLDHGRAARGAAHFAADNHPVRRDGDGSVRHAREGIERPQPSGKRALPVRENALDAGFVRGQRIVDFGFDDVDRGPVRHEPRLIHLGLADTLKPDRLAPCFQRQPDHLLEADVPVGCPPRAGFRLDPAGNLKAAALESQCGPGTEAQLVGNGDGYAPSAQSEHHRAALDRLTNGRDIDQAAHILLAYGEGETARADKRLRQALRSASGRCTGQLEGQCDNLVRSGSKSLEIGERKIRRQVHRDLRQTFSNDFADFRGDPALLDRVQPGAGRRRELDLGVLRRWLDHQPHSGMGLHLVHVESNVQIAVNRRGQNCGVRVRIVVRADARVHSDLGR